MRSMVEGASDSTRRFRRKSFVGARAPPTAWSLSSGRPLRAGPVGAAPSPLPRCGMIRSKPFGDIPMPASSTKQSSGKQPADKQFLKRRTVDQGIKLADDAHAAVWRLYCDVFRFWRWCFAKPCKRHRRCSGEPARCLMQCLPSVPPAERPKARMKVIAGGPRRIPPASHMEYLVRRQELPALTAWRGGAGERK